MFLLQRGEGVNDQLGIRVLVALDVSEVLGREEAVLVDEKKGPGSYTVQFNGRGLASGVYLIRLTAGDFVQSKKLFVLT